MKNKIYVPTKNVDSWKELLLDPEKQWETGFSARTIAHCWEDQESGFPNEFIMPLKDLGFELNVLLAIPEYKVPLNNNRAPSQNDLFVLSKSNNCNELVVMMIEGKVDEPFDKSIKNWYLSESNGKKLRFEFLANELEISPNISEHEILRYQLFHRTASAILTAKQFNAKKAIMVVQSFSEDNKWHKDYLNFAQTLNPNLNAEVGTIEKCKTLKSGIELYVGWIKGDCKYLKK